jgi:N-acetylglutamate synthase-like GNAT family acetyltransferase
MEQNLENIKSDIILFASTFKTLFEAEGGIDFKDAFRARIESKKAIELSPKEKETLKLIFLKNWKEKYPKNISDVIYKDFEEIIEGDSDFYLLKYNNEVVTFLRATEISAQVLEIGSFNVREEAISTKIAEVFFKQVIEKLAIDNVLKLSVYVSNESLINYYERMGFKKNGMTTPPPGEVSVFVDMERNDALSYRKAA